MRCGPAVFLAGLFLWAPVRSRAETIREHVVCVEAAWCDIAAQVGGPDVSTDALLATPGIDPHDLSPSPSMARALAGATIAIINGATYDDWALPFVASVPERIVVATASGWQPGDNPHLFLDPDVVGKVAEILAERLTAHHPEDRDGIARRLAVFLGDLQRIRDELVAMKRANDALPVAAVEPVGQQLLEDAGLKIMDLSFALAIMNHAEPSPRDVARVDALIDGHDVRMLITNPAIHSPQIDRMTDRARAASIPLVSIGETLPPGQRWQEWVRGILHEVQVATGGGDDLAR